jgi:hypothetical protein
MKAILTLSALALGLLACDEPNDQGDNPRSLVGKAAPKLVVQNWSNSGGKPLTLASLRGKVVVLDFWAHW